MSDTADFQVFEGEEFYAEASGPRESAWGEAMNYASQVEEPRIEEVMRFPVPMGELPPACPFSDGAKWTKVTEELPDGDETVIVHGHTGYRGFGWHDGEYWRDCVSGDRFANLKLNIEHWMPLPEAPK